jgi:hypothetical protein
MPAKPFVWAALVIIITIGISVPGPLSAQTIEATPLAGYRFGGDLFELAAGRPVDLDGAPVVGGALNIEMDDGLWFEAIYTHQEAKVTIPGDAFRSPATQSIVVDHWLAGGRQEFGTGRARPFVSGLVGLTYYGAAGNNEIRFAVAAGGGVKLPLQRWLGLRLDSRLFTTFVDADARAVACAPAAGCFARLHVDVVWQMEFTVDAVVAFGSSDKRQP